MHIILNYHKIYAKQNNIAEKDYFVVREILLIYNIINTLIKIGIFNKI